MYILYSKCTDPAVATSQVNQLQLDRPIASRPSRAATRREPVATKRLTDCKCDTTLIATRRN
jgi:hypothetical protein